MNDKTLELLWLGAFRYYLGRMTYAVEDFTRSLIIEWPNISDEVKAIILRELRGTFEKDDRMRNEWRCCSAEEKLERSYHLPLGIDMDRREWEKVLEECK